MIKCRIHAALAFIFLLPSVSWGIVNVTDNLELEGFVKAQNIMRASSPSDTDFIMQRNTGQIEGKYYFLKEGQTLGQFDTGPLEEVTFTFIGRGVYDSIYDIRDAYSDLHGGSLESSLREAFVDLVMPPFTLRLGRQQVVWGETDNFRALDVINPLDLSWHWSRESWEDIRIPLWMARGIYDIGKLGPFEESFFEVVWIPSDFRPNKVEADPRYPWAFFGGGLPAVPNAVVIGDTLFDLNSTVRDRRPGRDLRNSQAGFRYKGIWDDIDFSFNYFSGFSATTGARIRSDLATLSGDTYNAAIDLVYPRIQVFGVTASYSEERYTQSVLRMESTVTTGVPVSIAAGAPRGVDHDQDQFDTVRQSVVMLGLDRPTWIRSLNDLRTFFLSGQIFWRRYLDYSNLYRGIPSVLPATIGGDVIPGRFVSTNTDKLDEDEFVLTFSASTSYGAAGLWKPQFVVAYDPRSTGVYNKLSVEYLFSKHLNFQIAQHFYWRVSGNDLGPWQLGDTWGRAGDRRNETELSVMFQF